MEDVATEVSEREQYLTFFLAEEEYAVTILQVREIIRLEELTKVPSAPPWIAGVINLRGSVVPVVDLGVKFGLGESEITKWTCVVVVDVEMDGEEAVMGILADQVSQVIELAPDDIEETPAFGTQLRVDYLVGMGKVGRTFVQILDSDRVLSANELLTALSLDDLEKKKAEAAEDAAGDGGAGADAPTEADEPAAEATSPDGGSADEDGEDESS